MKVLIVDDEYSTVQMIHQKIDWKSLHINEVRSAEDGEQAKEVIKDFLPDILLCDVEMPRVNGLELIKWIKENEMDLEIIILSCHDKFTYAQTAMHYGVKEYLLKPFRIEELNIALSKAVYEAEMKKEKKGESLEKNTYWEQGVLQRLYNHEIMGERILKGILRSRKSIFKIDRKYRMFYIGFNRSDVSANGYSKKQFNFILENIASELISQNVRGACAIRSQYDPFSFLIYFIDAELEMIRKKGEELIRIVDKYIKIPVYCCVSKEDTLFHVVNQRDEMEQYYLHQLKMGNSSLVFLEEQQGRDSTEEMTIDEDILLNLLRQDKFSEYTRYIREFMISLEKEHKLNLTSMKKLVLIISHTLYRLCGERELPISSIFSEEIVFRLQKEASYSISNMLKYVSYMIACIEEKQKVSRDEWGIINQVKQYISQHYMENIGRDIIARECNVSQGYLSKIFSDSVGMNLREYINLYRVNKSKQLLRDPDKTISYVAMEVGFESLSYFSTIFKKICGETPVEWRKKIFL